MKKILLLIFSVLIFSCYPRTSAVELQKESVESHASIKDLSTIEKKEDIGVKIDKSEAMSDTKKEDEIKKDLSSKTSNEKQQLNTSENSSKLLKNKTYYPNGQLQSEMEVSENYSKLHSELNEQIQISKSLSEWLKKSRDSSNFLRSENLRLKKHLSEESENRKQLEFDAKEVSKNKIKNTQTEGFPWLGVLLGAAITILCVVVYTKLKSKLSIIS